MQAKKKYGFRLRDLRTHGVAQEDYSASTPEARAHMIRQATSSGQYLIESCQKRDFRDSDLSEVLLSVEHPLHYILRDGDGSLATLPSGKLRYDDSGGLAVYDEHDEVVPHLSGTHIRSWYVLGTHGQRESDWYDILDDDMQKFIFGPR